MSTIFIVIFSFVFAACAHNPQPKAFSARAVSSAQSAEAESEVNRDANQLLENETPTPATEAPTSGRKVNVPANQAEIIDRCEKMLSGIPENLKQVEHDFPISHRSYKLSYNMKHRLPNWVFYSLSRDNLMNSCAKRKDKFKGDPALFAANIPMDAIVGESGYKNSGFDRGHMAPSGDFTWDQDINEETFFMTNMSPQTAELNQKTWNQLELRVRDWACGFGELKVYTGPIIEPNLKRLNSCVSIPNKFFKVLLGQKNRKLVGIAFVYDQSDKSGDPYKQNAVSIRKVEEMSGLNFFKDDYAQKVQDEFETQFDLRDWDGMEEKCFGCNGVIKK